MASRNQLRLEPTFPLDGMEIQRRVRRAMFKGLAPLGALGVVVTAAMAFMMDSTGLVLGLALTGYGLQRVFRTSLSKVEAREINAMIHEHNRSQDRQSEEVVGGLRERGFHPYASALGKFILLKQRIESNLHKNRVPNASNEQLDNLVDRICSLTCDHLAKLSELDEKVGSALTKDDVSLLRKLEQERSHILIRVQRAYCTMYECLDGLIDFKVATTTEELPVPEAKSLSAMENAIELLEQENKVLKDIMSRVQADTSLPPPPIEQFGESVDEKREKGESGARVGE